MSFLPFVQAGLGVAGLLQSGQANRQSAEAMRQANRLTGLRASSLERLLKLADLYDPAQEDRAAIDYAGNVTRDNLQRGLVDLNTDWANGGGSLGDTRFRARVQGMTNRVGDPLREISANLASTRTQRKAQLLSQGLASGNDIAGSYLQQSQMMASDPSASLALLGQGIGNMIPKAKKEETPAQPETSRNSTLYPPAFNVNDYAMGKRFDTGIDNRNRFSGMNIKTKKYVDQTYGSVP
jgi:hypothetical protein